MKILIKARGNVKNINNDDFKKIKELSRYLIEKYDIKVEIKNFKIDSENNS
jgi:hypothetical protein